MVALVLCIGEFQEAIHSRVICRNFIKISVSMFLLPWKFHILRVTSTYLYIESNFHHLNTLLMGLICHYQPSLWRHDVHSQQSGECVHDPITQHYGRIWVIWFANPTQGLQHLVKCSILNISKVTITVANETTGRRISGRKHVFLEEMSGPSRVDIFAVSTSMPSI